MIVVGVHIDVKLRNERGNEMPNWSDEIASQKSGQLNGQERQGLRVILDRFVTRERIRAVVRSYVGWLTVTIPLAIAVAKLFLDHGTK